eukprot:577868-Rhodomonas_salina.1
MSFGGAASGAGGGRYLVGRGLEEAEGALWHRNRCETDSVEKTLHKTGNDLTIAHPKLVQGLPGSCTRKVWGKLNGVL